MSSAALNSARLRQTGKLPELDPLLLFIGFSLLGFGLLGLLGVARKRIRK